VASTWGLLLMSFVGADLPEPEYRQLQAEAAHASTRDDGRASTSARGMVMSHRDWIHTDRARAGIADQWQRFFRDWDVLLCPVMPTPAFPHDRRDMEARRIMVDDQAIPYAEQSVWMSIASLPGLPATAMPIGRSAEGLPIGLQAVGPYLEDRTTIEFARLFEREFGGFVAPPRYR
jgi:amidase